MIKGINEVKAFWDQITVRWKQLSRREQWISSIGIGALIIWLIWQCIAIPLSNGQAQAEKKLAASNGQLLQMEQQAEQILALRATGAKENPSANKPIDNIVHQVARRYRIAVQRVQNRGELLDIQLANTRFDTLMGWLVTLEQSHRIKVRNIQLESTETSGMVEVRRLQLERD